MDDIKYRSGLTSYENIKYTPTDLSGVTGDEASIGDNGLDDKGFIGNLIQGAKDLPVDIAKDFIDANKYYGIMETAVGIGERAADIINFEKDPNYNFTKDEKLLGYGDEFIDRHIETLSRAKNADHAQEIAMKMYKRELFEDEYNKRDAYNIASIAGFVSAMSLDVTNVIPAVGFRKLARGSSALYNATSFAGATAIREYAQTNRTTTTEEKLLNIGMAGAVGAGIGALVGKQSFKSLTKEDIAEATQDTIQKLDKIDVAATRIDPTTLKAGKNLDEYVEAPEDIRIDTTTNTGVSGKVFNFLNKRVFSRLNPTGRLYNSSLSLSRWAVNKIGGTSLKTNSEDVIPLQYFVSEEANRLSKNVIFSITDEYVKFLKATPNSNLSIDDFESALLTGLRKNSFDDLDDFDSALKPFIESAAKTYKKTTDELMVRLKESGVVNKDATISDEFYIPTQFNRDAVTADLPNFQIAAYKSLKSGTQKQLQKEIQQLNGINLEDLLGLKFIKYVGKDRVNYKKIQDRLNLSEVDVAKKIETLSAKYGISIEKDLELIKRAVGRAELLSSDIKLKKAANKYIDDTVIGSGVGKRLGLDVDSIHGKKFYFDQSHLGSYLENDIKSIVQGMARNSVLSSALKSNFGDTNLKGLFKQLDLEAAKTLKADPSKGKEISAQLLSDKTDIIAMVNRMAGRRSDGSIGNTSVHGALAWLRTFTTIGLMGSSALSQIPDFVQVSRRMFKYNLDAAEAFEKVVVKLDQRDLVKLNMAAENWLEDIRMGNLDGVHNAGDLTKVGAVQQKISSAYYRAVFMTAMNDFMQRLATEDAADAIVKLAFKKKLNSKDLEILKALRLTKKDIINIRPQIKKFSAVGDDGVRLVSGMADWEGATAIKIRAAITFHVRKSIIMPGVGTKPLFFDNSAFGEFFGQFKGFMVSAMENFVLTDLQAGNAAYASRFALRTMAGLVAYYSREIIRKPWSEVNKDPKVAIHEAIFRSGAVSGADWLMDTADMFNLGPSRVFGTNRSGRRANSYGTDPFLRTAAGAPGVVVADISKTIFNIGNGETNLDRYKYLSKYVASPFYIQAVVNRVFD